jgi:hypothetical protein
MSDRETGGPAFPTDEFMDDGKIKHTPGMTLRDYFATNAMQALIAKAPLRFFADQDADERSAMEKSFAVGAYEYADAIIAERAK